MPIEKQDIDQEGQLPSIYNRSIKILTEGGVNIQQAYEIIERCHDRFHKEAKPKIIEQALFRVLDELCNTPGVKLAGKIDAILAKTQFEIERSFVSSPDAEEKTIYRGPGGVELKESSNN